MSGGCALCVGPDGECVVPFFSKAPAPGSVDPWSSAFLPDPESAAHGVYWCPACGAGEQEARDILEAAKAAIAAKN